MLRRGSPWCGGAIRILRSPARGEGISSAVRLTFLRGRLVSPGERRTRVAVGGGRGGRGGGGKRHEPLKEVETQCDPESLAENVARFWCLQ